MSQDLSAVIPRADFARLRSYLFCLLGDRDQAEDLLSETLLRFLQKGPREEEASVQGWLMRTARNLAFNQRRSGQRRKLREEEFRRRQRDDEAAGPAVEAGDRSRLEECLAFLGRDLAELVWLKFVDGLSLRAIEALVEQPRSTLALRLQEALVSLQLCIEGESR